MLACSYFNPMSANLGSIPSSSSATKSSTALCRTSHYYLTLSNTDPFFLSPHALANVGRRWPTFRQHHLSGLSTASSSSPRYPRTSAYPQPAQQQQQHFNSNTTTTPLPAAAALSRNPPPSQPRPAPPNAAPKNGIQKSQPSKSPSWTLLPTPSRNLEPAMISSITSTQGPIGWYN